MHLRNWETSLFVGALLLLTISPAHALIGLQYQMQLGNPSGAIANTNDHSHFLIQRTVEAIDYNDALGEPNWASWDLAIGDVGDSGRSSSFFTDTNLPSNFYHVTSSDYKNSGYDRGHMCPSADRTGNTTDNDLVFFMSNIIPQSPVNNQTVWANFEAYCRSLAQDGNEILIICGPSGFSGARIQPSGKVAIPDYTWKIAVVVTNGAGMATNRVTENTRVIAIKIPNNDDVSSNWQNYLTSPQEIQNDTGLTFFTGLSPAIAAILRNKIDEQTNLPPGIDLVVSSTHAGDFTQGDSNVLYKLTVNNIGATASSGVITVTNFLPNGLIPIAINGMGWTVDFDSLSASRSDVLEGGTNFPPIYITANVASNAPARVTNIVTISGGSDTNVGNNTYFDVTTIIPGTNAATPVLLAGFDVSGQTNFGLSPMPATTNALSVTAIGLTRGTGVTTSGTAARRAWGGTGFADASAEAAIASNRFFTFKVTPTGSNAISYTSISRFDYRRSGTGPTNGLIQYQIGSGPFLDVTNVVYTAGTSAGGSLGPIDLSGISALQNVTNSVTFRIVNWNGSAGGTWYVFDFRDNSDPDLTLEGTVSTPLTPIELWRLNWFGTTADSGAAADTNIVTSDGMPNLLKYALGLNPTVPANNPVIGSISNNFLYLTVPRNPDASDISFWVEGTSNLSSAWSTNNAEIDIDTTASSLLQAHYINPLNVSPRAFMRLRVTRP